MNKSAIVIVFSCIMFVLASCKKDKTTYNDVLPFDGASMTLQGLASNTEIGINASNSVFVDMSKNLQTSVARTTWDLGFYSGAGFKVILNHSLGATAIQLNKTDLLTVGTADTVALATNGTLTLGAIPGNTTIVDPMVGDSTAYISNTVISVAENDADNKVYLINRGIAGGVLAKSWIKLKVTRVTNGYAMTFGGINDQQLRSVTINKNSSFNFSYITLSGGSSVVVEPASPNWDFEWTLSTYKNATGDPSAQPDFVLINFLGGVKAAQMIFSGTAPNTTVNYDNFGVANISDVTFLGTRDVIGTNWRNTITTAGSIAVYGDRYYVIKDPVGNIYKLRFNRFAPSDGATRGRPVLEFKLVQAIPPTRPVLIQ